MVVMIKLAIVNERQNENKMSHTGSPTLGGHLSEGPEAGVTSVVALSRLAKSTVHTARLAQCEMEPSNSNRN
jgi:hypothetical protein